MIWIWNFLIIDKLVEFVSITLIIILTCFIVFYLVFWMAKRNYIGFGFDNWEFDRNKISTNWFEQKKKSTCIISICLLEVLCVFLCETKNVALHVCAASRTCDSILIPSSTLCMYSVIMFSVECEDVHKSHKFIVNVMIVLFYSTHSCCSQCPPRSASKNIKSNQLPCTISDFTGWAF